MGVARIFSRAGDGHGATPANGTAAAGGHGETTVDPAKAAMKAARRKWTAEHLWYFWWAVAGAMGLCILAYAFHIASTFYYRRKGIRARKANSTTAPAARHGGVRNLPRAIRTTLNNLAYNQVIPLSIYTRSTVAEWFWTMAYIAITLALGFRAGHFPGQKLDYANAMGMISFAQTPLIVGLAGRNNVLSMLTGISYEKLNFLHRAAGRACGLTSALHIFGWIHKGLGKHGPGTDIFRDGVIAGIGLLLVLLTSVKWIRTAMYEFFLISHIIFVLMFLVGGYFHWPRLRYYIWPALFLWGLDRFVGLARLFVINKWRSLPLHRSKHRPEHCADVEVIHKDVVRLTLHRPSLHWFPGQHGYLIMPEVALLRYEQHPFTIANIPDQSGNVVFIVKAQQGFTKRLMDRTLSDVTRFRTYFEGPYGEPHNMNHFDSVILIAGGTGVTHALSHLLDIIRCSRKESTAVSFVRLVWNVRSASYASWIAPQVNAAIEAGTGTVRIQLDFHVTRSPASAEPDAEQHHPEAEKDSSPNASDASTPSTLTPYDSSEDVSTKEEGSSASDHDEKAQMPASPTKLATSVGLSTAAAQFSTFHFGRSHIEHILREDVNTSSINGAGVGVSVCGPTALALDARRAVCKVNTASAVLGGQVPISFYSGNFGF